MTAEHQENSKESNGQRRAEQLEQVQQMIRELRAKPSKARADEAKHALLESVTLGLYDEVDKLTKKAPAEPITDLVLGEINEVIRETKELVTEDPYVQRIQVFVAAGDNPQHRDAVVVLRQLRQGLERFKKEHVGAGQELRSRVTMLLQHAMLIESALLHYLENEHWPDGDYLAETVSAEAKVIKQWLVEGGDKFNSDKLDRIEIERYLAI